MKNSSLNKLKKINKKEILEKPLKVFKKINFNKFKKITTFSLNKTIDNFKEKIKQAKIDNIKSLKKEKIKEAKKQKLEQKKKKIEEAKKIKKEQLSKKKRRRTTIIRSREAKK